MLNGVKLLLAADVKAPKSALGLRAAADVRLAQPPCKCQHAAIALMTVNAGACFLC